MFVFDGINKEIVVSDVSSFSADQLHKAAVSWSVLSVNMQYLLPTSASGKSPLGNSVYTDIIYVLENGWKLKPSGYGEGQQILVSGTFITSDSSPRTLPQDDGECPSWVFQVNTFGTISTIGSGVTEQDKIDIANLIKNDGYLTEDNFLALK